MGVKNLVISLNHPTNTYSGGQQIRGNVHFELEHRKNVRGIYVKYKGIADVLWTERQPKTRTASRKHSCVRVLGGNTRRDFTPYKGTCEYFNEKIYLVGGNDGKPFDLAPGQYDYKFDFDLPVGIPPSFEGDNGSIRYTVKIGLDIPIGFDETEKIPLQILLPIDLTKMSHLKNPVQESTSKYLGCWCCQSGPLRMDISLLKTGYSRGENIPIVVDVENRTSSLVESVEGTLKKKMTFYSQDPEESSKEVREDVCSVDLGNVPVRSTKNYGGVLVVPKDTPYNINECSIIKLEYVLEVEAHIRGWYANLTASIPVTIGSMTEIREQSESVSQGLGPPYPTMVPTWFPRPYSDQFRHIDDEASSSEKEQE